MEISNIELNRLVEHPNEADIYGEYFNDAIFEASIKEQGVLQPLLVTDAAIYYGDDRGQMSNYVVISGHRRKYGSLAAGLTEVPCIYKTYKNRIEADLDFIASNANRPKTEAQIIKEFLYYKQILCQFAQVRKSKGAYADTLLENDEISRIGKSLNIVPGEPLNSEKLIEKHLGLSKYKQAVYSLLYDTTKRAKTYEDLRLLGSTVRMEDEIDKLWNEVVEKYEKEEISLKQAQDLINTVLNDARTNLLKKQKPKKEKKEKEPKEEKKAVLFRKDGTVDKIWLESLTVKYMLDKAPNLKELEPVLKVIKEADLQNVFLDYFTFILTSAA